MQLLIEARRLIAREEHAQAIERLDKILAVGSSGQPDHGPAYAERVVTELPLEAKALCLFRLGAYSEAAAYEAAAWYAPENEAHRVKAKLARARAGESRSV